MTSSQQDTAQRSGSQQDTTPQEESTASENSHSYAMPWSRVQGPVRRVLQTVCALAPLILVSMGVPAWIAAIPAVYPTFILLRRGYRRLRKHVKRTALSGETGIRILLGVLPLVAYTATGTRGVVGWITMILLALLPLGEPLVTRVAPGRKLRVANLPGISDFRRPLFPVNVVLLVDLAATTLTTILVLVHVPGGALLPLPLIAIVVAAASMLDSLKRVRESVGADNNLYAAVDAYQPTFVLYYAVPAGSSYQVGMWIEFLERIGEPFIVVLRKTSAFREITKLTDAPVVVRTNIWQLDDVITPSITTAFYVNNSAPNVQLVRYPQMTHVQLLHGDSDKASSFNPVTVLYDKVFVAGQAGIDRYANNGVDIPAEKFEIVGRPQVEAVAQQGPENLPVQRVLYAPTWEGHYADTNYGSLPVGPAIVENLLARGMTVVFRPHPFSYRNDQARANIRAIKQMLREDVEKTGHEHLWGRAAEKDLDAFGCFNAADAMISDVSSVVPDFLYSGKPYGLVSMSFTVEEFEQEFPLAGSAYVIRHDLENLDQALDELLVTDSKAAQRKATREYYLGPFPPENYADAFVGTAREIVLHPTKPTAVRGPLGEGGEGADEYGRGEDDPASRAPGDLVDLDAEDDPSDETEREGGDEEDPTQG
jgi:hypothetical protein